MKILIMAVTIFCMVIAFFVYLGLGFKELDNLQDNKYPPIQMSLITEFDTIQLELEPSILSNGKTGVITIPYAECTSKTYKISTGGELYIRRAHGDTILIELRNKASQAKVGRSIDGSKYLYSEPLNSATVKLFNQEGRIKKIK